MVDSEDIFELGYALPILRRCPGFGVIFFGKKSLTFMIPIYSTTVYLQMKLWINFALKLT